MSSMLKKSGGLSFKPKIRRAAAPFGSASGSANLPQAPTDSQTQSPATTRAPASIDTSTQKSQGIKSASTGNAAEATPATTSGPSVVHTQEQTHHAACSTSAQPNAPSSTKQPTSTSNVPKPTVAQRPEAALESAVTVSTQSSTTALADVSTPRPPSQTTPAPEQLPTPAPTQPSASTPRDGANRYKAAKPTPAREAPVIAPTARPFIAQRVMQQTTPAPETPARTALPKAPPTVVGQGRMFNSTPGPEAEQRRSDSNTPGGTPHSDDRAPFTTPMSPAPFLVSDTITAISPSDENAQAGTSNSASKKKRVYRKRKATTEGEENGEGFSAPPKKKRAPRKKTSANEGQEEDAEEQRVDHATTKMSEITKDLGIGQKFKHADAIRERHREARTKAKKRSNEKRLREKGILPDPEEEEDGNGNGDGDGDGAGHDSHAGTPTQGDDVPAAANNTAGAGVSYEVIDGQIVINQNSLVIDNGDGENLNLETVEEDEFSNLVTSASFRRESRQTSSNRWTKEETQQFYKYLKIHGTNFELVADMLPHKNRRQVKLKFNREEKLNPARITAAVVPTAHNKFKIDLEEYKKRHKGEWFSKEDILAQQAEKDEENQKQLDEYKQERRERGLLDEEDEDALDENAPTSAGATKTPAEVEDEIMEDLIETVEEETGASDTAAVAASA